MTFQKNITVADAGEHIQDAGERILERIRADLAETIARQDGSDGARQEIMTLHSLESRFASHFEGAGSTRGRCS